MAQNFFLIYEDPHYSSFKMQRQIMFLVVQSHGTPIRTFIVPLSELWDEWHEIEYLLDHHIDNEFAFDDKNSYRTLWIIGQRLGVVRQGNESPDLAKYEQSGNCSRANVCAFLIGTVDQ